MAIIVLIFLVCTCIALIPTVKFILFGLILGSIIKFFSGGE